MAVEKRYIIEVIYGDKRKRLKKRSKGRVGPKVLIWTSSYRVKVVLPFVELDKEEWDVRFS